MGFSILDGYVAKELTMRIRLDVFRAKRSSIFDLDLKNAVCFLLQRLSFIIWYCIF